MTTDPVGTLRPACGGTHLDGNDPQKDPGDRSEILLNDGTGHFTLAPQSDPGQMQENWASSA